MSLVFIYGTLKLGHPNNLHFLGNQKFIAPVRTLPEYRLYDCGEFPAMVESAEGLSVEGELWEVDEECLRKLDLLECVEQGVYERRMIELQVPTAEAQAYLYLLNIQGLFDCGSVWKGDALWAKKTADCKNERNVSEENLRRDYTTGNSEPTNKPTLC